MIDFKKYIKLENDFPKKGVSFRDMSPLLYDGKAFGELIDVFAKEAKALGAEVIVGPDARGFILGAPISKELGLGFVPIRKPGKLPGKLHSIDYDLEYGKNSLSIQEAAPIKGKKVYVVDDVLATGGTMKACLDLLTKCGAKVVGVSFLIEIEELKGKSKLSGFNVNSILKY